MAVYVDWTGVVRRKGWAAKWRPLRVTRWQDVWAVLSHNRKAVLEPASPDDVEGLLKWLLGWKRRASEPSPMWVFLDEIHLYSSKHDFPHVNQVFTVGRNYNVTGVAITQQPSQVANRTIIGNSWFKVLFSIDPGVAMALRREYSIIVPADVLEWVNQDAAAFEGERRIYNAAVLNLRGGEWVRI